MVRRSYFGEGNPFFGKKHTDVSKEQMSESQKRRNKKLGVHAGVNFRSKVGNFFGENNPMFGTTRVFSKETKKKMRESRLRWIEKNPEKFNTIIQKALHARIKRPNKSEQEVLDFLNREFPNEWKYVGDGSLMFGRFNPDFINIDKNILLEFYGYTHINEGDRRDRRLETFLKHGYRTIEIWYFEMKDKVVLRDRILFYC